MAKTQYREMSADVIKSLHDLAQGIQHLTGTDHLGAMAGAFLRGMGGDPEVAQLADSVALFAAEFLFGLPAVQIVAREEFRDTPLYDDLPGLRRIFALRMARLLRADESKVYGVLAQHMQAVEEMSSQQ